MRADETVMVMGEDVGWAGGVFRVTQELHRRVRAFAGLGHAARREPHRWGGHRSVRHGMRPVAEIQFADFITPAFDQIVNEAARLLLPLQRRLGSAGDDPGPLRRGPWRGPLPHPERRSLVLQHPGPESGRPDVPGGREGDAQERHPRPNPVLFLEHKRTYRLIKEDVPEDGHEVPLGRARVHREGTDLTVVAYGLVLYTALRGGGEALQRAPHRGRGRRATGAVPDGQETILGSVKKTGKILAATEVNLTGSVSGEIAAVVAREAFEWLDGPVMRLGGPDVPAAPYARPMLDSSCRRREDRGGHARAGPLLESNHNAYSSRPLSSVPFLTFFF